MSMSATSWVLLTVAGVLLALADRITSERWRHRVYLRLWLIFHKP